MMELTRREMLGVSAMATHDNVTIAPRITCLERVKKLCARVLSFFRNFNRAIFMSDYEVAMYFMWSEAFENVVRVENGYIVCRLVGCPSIKGIKKVMKPTRRDFTLEGNLVFVELLNNNKRA